MKATVEEHVNRWWNHPDIRQSVTSTWDKLTNSMNAMGERHWGIVKGPTASTIATLKDLSWGLTEVYIDESGAANFADVRTRRCGWGAAILRPDTSLYAGWASTIPGDYQTPMRATLSAVIYVLQRVSGDVLLKPDSEVFLLRI